MNRIFTKPLLLLFFIGLISSISEPTFAQKQKKGGTRAVNHDRFIVTPKKKNKVYPLEYIGTNSDGDHVMQALRAKFVYIPLFSFISYKDYIKSYNDGFIPKKDYKLNVPKGRIKASIFRIFFGSSSTKSADILTKYIINHKTGTYFFYAEYNKKCKCDLYKYSKLNLDDFTNEEVKTLFKLNLEKGTKRKSAVYMRISPDSSKLLFFHEIKPKDKKDKSLFYRFYVVNEDFELEFSKTVEFGINRNYTNIQDLFVGDNGNVLIISKTNNSNEGKYDDQDEVKSKKKKNKRQEKRQKKREKKRGKNGVTIHLLNNSENSELDFGLKPDEIFSAKFAVDLKGNPIIYGTKVGSYSKKIEESLFKVTLSSNLEILSTSGIESLDKTESKNENGDGEDDEDEDGKKKKKKKKTSKKSKKGGKKGGNLGDLPSSIVQNLLIDSKGNYYILTEEFEYTTRTETVVSTNVKTGAMTTTTETIYVYRYGDINIFKFNDLGELLWKKVVHKYAVEEYDSPLDEISFSADAKIGLSNVYSRYTVFFIKEKIQIFFNESLQNTENSPVKKSSRRTKRKGYGTMRVKIDQEGKIEKDVVGSAKIENFSLPSLEEGFVIDDRIVFPIHAGFLGNKIKYCMISIE